jgi:hypothetical protein
MTTPARALRRFGDAAPIATVIDQAQAWRSSALAAQRGHAAAGAEPAAANTGITFGMLLTVPPERSGCWWHQLAVVAHCLAVARRHPDRGDGDRPHHRRRGGNIIDRLRIGAVTDFIDAHYGGWHWPTLIGRYRFRCAVSRCWC